MKADEAKRACRGSATNSRSVASRTIGPPPISVPGVPKTEDLLQAIVEMQQRVVDTNERLIRTEERLITTQDALLETQRALIEVLKEIRDARRGGTRNITLQCRIPTFEEE